jgi:hypothetical protein
MINASDLAKILDQEGMRISHLGGAHKVLAASLHSIADEIRLLRGQRDKDEERQNARLAEFLDSNA